ncbi:hypothetical protein BCR33DRAFT_696905 [Rhizoclosmatium globosum]|uniref:Phosphatidylethanolamine N-methyltransferase n=1 Tax=Rhizoclosmatium globosum TaxID=329046 RepID=A0A1Y2CG46_9FUNG|nr:hypothetical protein BCR33DRAFT_696905 [Rhizoclosmatium globosum]|eukprot:ORY45887.1 hypothetical protein BCR33DRAFT_696905 [Rhizoclosmatium globosum]
MVTVGRTRDGKVFALPNVHPLVHSLLFPAALFDWAILASIALSLSLFLLAPLPKEAFLALFVFWRISYNLLLGALLRLQSDYNILVRYAKRYGFGPNAGKRRGPWQSWLIGEVLKKLELDDKEFNTLPVEFTTWILFRSFVDTVLVNDFLSHTLFGIAYFKPPVYDGSGPELFGIGWRDWLRYSAATLLLLINYGIKMEGNRVVSDFAWYWGDFFFFQVSEPPPTSGASSTTSSSSNQNTNPTAESSSFELAPHPMYSVGYIGFYATALIAKSYTVFFVSLGAHISQILFFFFVESHHFERTYGTGVSESTSTEVLQSLFRRDLLIFKNFDAFRSTDLLTVLVWILTLVNAMIVGRVGEEHEKNWKVWYFVGQALFWRVMFSGVLGYILHLQSKYTFWSRHFIKFGETSFDAFRHWKIIYNLCQSMTYISFFLCAFMLYKPPEVWLVGSVMLKHTLAVLLILLHIWTTFSIHKTLGEYGWFFGDFFIDSLTTPSKQSTHPTLTQGPTYTGLYRFLNHPNAWAAAASAWGITVVTGSPHVLMVTVIGQFLGWCFVFLVEAPHMRRRYGARVRSDAEEVFDVDVYRPGGAVSPRFGSFVGLRGGRRRIGGGAGGIGSRRVSEGAFSAFSRVGSGAGGGGGGVVGWNGPRYGFSSEDDRRGGNGGEDDDEDQGIMMKGAAGGLAGGQMSGNVDDEDGFVGSGSDGDDEDDVEPRSTGGVSMSGRSYSNPLGRNNAGASSAAIDRMSASMDSYIPPSMSKSYDGGSSGFLAKNLSSGSLKKVKSPIATAVQDAVNKAKPRVDKIVKGARNIVKSNVEKFAGSHWSQTQQLPRHLYTVTIPIISSYPVFSSSTNTPRYQLGTPITIDFTCVRETLKRRDWIGIYPVGENLSTEVTTSKSYSRWMFLTAQVKTEDDDATTPLMTKIPAGMIVDDENSTLSGRSTPLPSIDEPRQTRSARKRTISLPLEQKLLFGNTVVQVRPSDEDEGLRIVSGSLCFRRSKIPWQVGTYEARYHYDGGYSVVAISKPFEIVAECFQWMDDGTGSFGIDGGLEANEKEIERIEVFLRSHVERCVDIDVRRNEEPLLVNEDILSRVVMDAWIPDLNQFRLYKENVAKRIVYGIKQMFGIDFSWHVVGYMGTVRLLARRIFEAKQALSPSPPPLVDGYSETY